MTLGAAASNPASKGPGGPQCLLPRSPRTRLTLRRVAWLAGIDAPCTALRATLRPLGPRPPRVCPAAPAGVPRGPRGCAPRPPRCLACMRARGAVLATGTRGPAAMLCRTRRGRRGPQRTRKYEESQQQRRRVRLRARVRLCKLRMRLCFFAVASLIRHDSGLGKQPNTSVRAPERRSPSLQAGRSESAWLRCLSERP
jgi:hypothetical protein